MPNFAKLRGRYCSVNNVKKLFPILRWLPLYGFSKLRCDLIAGIAVSLLVIPQGLAHATIAGLPPQYGLYTSFPAMFVYVFFGTCKDLHISSTVITALLTNRYSITEDVNPEIASSLAFLVGVVLVAVAVFRLAFIVRLLSFPVISGFVSASAVMILIIQLAFLFGLSKPPRQTYLKVVHLFENIQRTSLADALLGITTIGILLMLKKLASRERHANSSAPRWKKILVHVTWAIGIGRNAAVAIVSILVSYLCYVVKGDHVFITVGNIPAGLPTVKMPLQPIKISANRTIEVKELIVGFGTGLGILPVIIIIQAIGIAKSLARKNKYNIDTSQEIVASGLMNVFASFFSGFPVTAGFSRSAVNSISGAKTCFSGVVASVIVVLVIQFFGPLFRFLPYSTLAAMSIASVIKLIDHRLARKLWHINKADFVVWLATFCGCLYEFEAGILAGVLLSLCFLLYSQFNPRLDLQFNKESQEMIVSLKGGVSYTGIEAVANKITGVLEKEEKGIDEVLIDCKNMLKIDYTVIHGLTEIIADCKLVNVEVRFINVEDNKIRKHLEDAGFLKSNPDASEDVTGGLVESGEPVQNGVIDNHVESEKPERNGDTNVASFESAV